MTALLQANNILIEKHETYKKQTYRNRYLIAGPNGIQPLTIPVDKNGLKNCPITDVKISYDNNWQKLHWKSWETAYNSSPFFLYYKDDFKKIFDKKHNYLLDLNTEMLELILDLTETEITIGFTSDFQKKYEGYKDYREIISPKVPPLTSSFPEYYQVFSEKYGFLGNLSVIDLLFNLGNESGDYLSKLALNQD